MRSSPRHGVQLLVVPPVNIRHAVAATRGTSPQDVRKNRAALSFLVSYGCPPIQELTVLT